MKDEYKKHKSIGDLYAEELRLEREQLNKEISNFEKILQKHKYLSEEARIQLEVK